MKIIILLGIIFISAVSCTFMETQVNYYKITNYFSVIPNVHGNVMIHTVLLSVIQVRLSLINIVCEPPKCHTSCAEPKNAICDVKCEKPECEIKCPDKGCEMFDCPKCVTVCKQPHCVTHCQAPKPECEPVCEEPKCDWKCHKPNCKPYKLTNFSFNRP
jgi:hypothetical protein